MKKSILLGISLIGLASLMQAADRATVQPPPAPTRIIVKFKPQAVAGIETALPASTLEISDLSTHPGFPAVLRQLRQHRLRPVFRHQVRMKKEHGWKTSDIAGQIRKKFPERAHRWKQTQPLPDLDRFYVLEPPNSSPEQLQKLVDLLKRDPSVEYAEIDHIRQLAFSPNDPYYAYGYMWDMAKISAPSAWDIAQGNNVTVADIDTGADPNHEDLQANLIPGYDFTANTSVMHDGHGHGTHTAGTIAAVGNNSKGVIGVAFHAKVLPLKAIKDDGWGNWTGTDSWFAEAIVYSADNGAQVANMSWGLGASWNMGNFFGYTMENALQYAHSMNMVLVAAAGNDGQDVDGESYYPATSPNVITVAATDSYDGAAVFGPGGPNNAYSNYGAKIDVAAPGLNIYSTLPGNTYASWSGTSMATPHVSGLAALILSQHPAYTNEQVRQIIRASADDIGSGGWDTTFGYGRINAARALQITGSATIPTITSISPASISAGSGNTVITINGTNFTSGSGVQKRHLEYQDSYTNLTTQYLSSTQMTATIPAADFQSGAYLALKVVVPGVGPSNGWELPVTAGGAPSLTKVTPTPASATAGSGSLSLITEGASFANNSVIQWNGQPLSTTFLSQIGLRASVPSSLMPLPGTVSITVNTPGQGTSGAQTLSIAPNPAVPIPVLSNQTATGTAGQSFNYQILASNNPALYAATGLPAGGTLALNAATGLISGTPTSADAGAHAVTLTATNAGGTSAQATLTLTVNSGPPTAPTITAQPAGQSVTVGGQATFSVTAAGTPPLNYQWYKNSVAISGATSAGYTTPATVLTDNGAQFTVVVNNAANQPVTSTPATLSVTALPPGCVTTLQPGNDLNAAVQACPAGTAFTLAVGTYRMQQVSLKDGDTITGAPGALLNGSQLVTSFSMSGSLWTATGLTVVYDDTRSDLCDPSYPACGHPQDVYFDDIPLINAGSAGAVTSGTYYFDYSNGTVYIADNPNGHKVEVGATSYAFCGNGTGVTIQNLTIEKYANTGQTGAVGGNQWGGSNPVNWTVQNCEIRLNHGAGVVFLSGAQIVGNFIHNNGQEGYGIGGGGTGGGLLANNEISFNNYARYNFGWECGGGKAAATNGLVIRNNYSHDNIGPGFWTDIDNINTTYVGNVAKNNWLEGIQHEISYSATITNNVFSGNGYGRRQDSGLEGWGEQIMIYNSVNVEIANNTIVVSAAAGNGIGLLDDPRQHVDHSTAYLANNYIHDNDISHLGLWGLSGAITHDPAGNPTLDPSNRFDYNHYHVPNVNAAYWQWASVGAENWSALHALNQEIHGTIDSNFRGMITTPVLGTTLPSGSVTFTWSSVAGAQYKLAVGSALGQGDIANYTTLTGTSQLVSALPTDGRTLYVRLQTYTNGSWQTPLDYTFQAATIIQPPTIIAQPAGQSVTVGGQATFSVTAAGTAPLNYQWYKNSAAISGATSAGYTTPATVLTDNGSQFTVVVNNAANQPVTSTPATLSVTALPPSCVTDLQPGSDVQAAVQACPAGTAFTLAAGTYRMQSVSLKDGDTITGAPGALLNGSQLVTSFSHSGSLWTATGLTVINDDGRTDICDAAYPYCYHVQDVYFDDKPLINAGSAGAVTVGKYFFDISNGTVYIADNPAGHKVEVGATSIAFYGPGTGVTIQNLTIEKYANEAQVGAVGGCVWVGCSESVNWTVRNCEIRLNHGSGVELSSGAQVLGNFIHDNGQEGYGIDGGGTGGGLFANNEISYNNYARYNFGWECGGGKASNTNGFTFSNNYSHDNIGPGFWSDINDINTTYTGNTVANNWLEGIEYEISYAGKITNNTLTGNGTKRVDNLSWLWGSQIMLYSSQNVEIAGNTLVVPAAAPTASDLSRRIAAPVPMGPGCSRTTPSMITTSPMPERPG